ncbi:MAG TPA: hypothetical protein VK750_10435 [Cytophagaceae bacterium]|jgi:hypothetical protein|nr:hypothetical protein [Cytophagaceae bacterium]
MNDTHSNTFYFWCCIVQSIVIIALACYAGKEKTEKEELVKEKEMNAFTLMVREAEINKLKAIMADTTSKHGEKK